MAGYELNIFGCRPIPDGKPIDFSKIYEQMSMLIVTLCFSIVTLNISIQKRKIRYTQAKKEFLELFVMQSKATGKTLFKAD